MAIIEGKFIKGSMNNLVYREYKGKQIVQSKPFTPEKNRTEGTIKAATVFGKASKLAFQIRVGLHDISAKFYDGTMIYRLNREILYCLNSHKDPETQIFNFKPNSFQSLIGFEFNTDSPVRNNLLVSPVVTLSGTLLQVHIPELKIPVDLKFPQDRLKMCRLVLATTMIDLANGRTESLNPQLIDFPYSYKTTLLPEQKFEFEVASGCLCITAISLQYVYSSVAGDVIVNSKSFNPTAIVHACIVEGEIDPLVTKEWSPNGLERLFPAPL